MKSIIWVLFFFPFIAFTQVQVKNNQARELLESGILKTRSSDFKGAMEDFNLAIKKKFRDSISSKIYFERAQLKRKELKDINGALEDYSAAIILDSNYTQAYCYRGLLFERNFRDGIQAEKDYLKSIKIDSTCGTCWMQLGYLLSKRSEGISKSIIALEKALELGIDLDFDGKLEPNFFIYDRLAGIEYERSDYRSALGYLQRLIDNYNDYDSDGDGINEDNDYLPLAYYNSAKIYYENLDEIELAIFNLNKAIQINPNGANSYYTLRAKIKYHNKDFKGANEDYELAKDTKNRTYYNDVFDYQEFYPYVNLNRELDSISLPVIVNTKIDIIDIIGLETTNDQFFMRVNYNYFTKQEPHFINYEGDTLTIFDFQQTQFISPSYINSDRLNLRDLNYDEYDKINVTDEVIYSGLIEADFFHNWNLKNYPFDKQKIQFEIVAAYDTSFIRLNQSEFYESNYKSVQGLKEGYKIEDIVFEEKFVEQSNEEMFYPGVLRKAVYSVATYSIILSRSGSWLFVKLFLGSFLAFIISWIVFLIPNKEFDSRISLTVGGIFGAIGNRYFVDSSMPTSQILTKADMINNLILFLLIFNVLIVVAQKSDLVNFGYLENNKFILVLTGFAFIILNSLIVLL